MRVRLNFSDVPEFPQGSVLMTSSEAAFFRGWFKRSLNDGVEWFSCRLKMPEVMKGASEYECRFAQKYECRLVPPDRYEFTFVLELKEQSLIQPGWEEFPQFWFMMNIIDMALNREWPEFTFDFPTYAAAMADIENLRSGQTVTVASDENNGGRHSVYKVTRADQPSISLNFLAQNYMVGQSADFLTLVRVYGI